MSAVSRRAGFTMVELLLAVGLFSVLMLALLRVVDASLTIWGRADQTRELSEMGGAVLDLLAEDVHALEAGARGDLLADWRLHDLDRDGIEGAPGQRLRLVRQVGAAELQRLAPSAGTPETFERGLVEVAWAWLPASGAASGASGGDGNASRANGTLWRGERLTPDPETLSFFAEGFFGPSGKAVPGSLVELTSGVLWFDAWFASQTSILHGGWELGNELPDCAASWDAWGKARPDPELTPFNLPAAGMPQAKDVPLLPRRVRIELELERESDLRTRTTLALPATDDASQLEVRDGRKVPADAGRMILVGVEWMEVLAVSGNVVSVGRGRRGTRATEHPADALVHHGFRSVREIPIDVTREDWDL
jgi:prepilin-type N-terminal cleavage/methylation domain-containing protein